MGIFNSNLLDKLIAFVVIILLLSLLVQTVQSLFKKLLKIKSRQIEASLLDLLQNALNHPPTPPQGIRAVLDASPVLQIVRAIWQWAIHGARAVRGGQPGTILLPGSPEHVQAKTLAVFGQLGRVAQSGKPMLDSLAKEDLLRVMTRLEPKDLLGATPAEGLLQRLATAVGDVVALTSEIKAVSGDPNLRHEASTKYHAFQAVVTPLLDDCANLTQAFASGNSAGGTNPGVLIQDLFALRLVHMQDAMNLLAAVQSKVQSDIAATTTDTAKAPLQDLADRLRKMTVAFGALQGECAAVTAAVRARIDGVGQWFDTVMQSFDERYARGMKTWGFVLAFCVVVWLNANFFHIYDAISRNSALTRAVVAQGEGMSRMAKQVDALTDHAQGATNVVETDQSRAALERIKATAQPSLNQAEQEAAIYSDLGFKPLGVKQIGNWFGNVGSDGWFFHTMGILGGWLLMTLLLSAGAPFWEDTLESLFGLKNLLRQDSSTKNIEQSSGSGQPKT